jgi:hypothetical protein
MSVQSPALVTHSCNPSYSGTRDQVRGQRAQIPFGTVSQNYSTQKGLVSGSSGRVPAYKCEALSSNHSTTKNKKRKKYLFRSFGHFKIGFVVFLLFICKSFFYSILNASLLSDV